MSGPRVPSFIFHLISSRVLSRWGTLLFFNLLYSVLVSFPFLSSHLLYFHLMCYVFSTGDTFLNFKLLSYFVLYSPLVDWTFHSFALRYW